MSGAEDLNFAETRKLFMERLLTAPNTPPMIHGRGKYQTVTWPLGSRGWWLQCLDAVDLVERDINA